MGLQAVAGAVINRFAVEIDPALSIEIELAALVRQDQCGLGIEAPVAILAELVTLAKSVPVTKVVFQRRDDLSMREVNAPLVASFYDGCVK